ncbi:hypothetical protein KC19_10G142200 [Ceratodon purpureus]|uniref:Uncharacterized protein n=1 Tax=Ceratodon purpureus TaxID=3225 RepID=A0A8T0GNX8_CERPU|nr:hypothetical protein KC19_10G142200 [Ceratodon purpureus]
MTAQVLALALLVHDAPPPNNIIPSLPSFLPSLHCIALHCIACSPLHPSAHSLSPSPPHSTNNQSPNPYLPASHTTTALFLISQLTYNSLLFTQFHLLNPKPSVWISYGGRASAFSHNG